MFVFFFNDTATTEIYTLSLHDALPICAGGRAALGRRDVEQPDREEDPARDRAEQQREDEGAPGVRHPDRKSTRLNSSHANISYAVFCLKKKTYTRMALPFTISR